MEPPIRHRPKLDLTIEETHDSEIVAAYSIARLKNESGGDPYWSVEVMRRAEIDKVRQASQTGAVGKTDRQGKPIPPKGPWVDWFGEMARKTVLRRHSKALPMSGDILETFERDIEQERVAESAAQFLSVEPDAPVSLPRADDLADGETIDGDTGEVTEGPRLKKLNPANFDENGFPRDAATGMTQVDEDAARDLDADHSGGDAEGPNDPYQSEVWADKRREIIDMFNAANDRDALRAADEQLVRHMQGFPGEIQQELEKAATEARTRLNARAKG